MKKYFVVLLILFVVSCGSSTSSSLGGSEIGNPSTPSRALLGLFQDNNCNIDKVIATDSLGQTTSGNLAEDCSFSIDLEADKAYAISFVRDDIFVASMIFNQGISDLDSTVFFMSEDDEAVDLGEIVINGTDAFPENQPSAQNDQDNDGINDFDDDDDDNDGQLDDQEIDCDLDGYLDDVDEDDDCDEEDENNEDNEGGEEDEDEDDEDDENSNDQEQNIILQVNPRNGAVGVSLDRELKVRTGCEIDIQTLNNDTFSISSSEETIACDFDLNANNTRIDCDPIEDFLPLETYTVVIEGVECRNGDIIPTTSWQFTTNNEDEDEDED